MTAEDERPASAEPGTPPVVPYRRREPALRERSRLVVAVIVLVIAKLVLVMVNFTLAMVNASAPVRLAGVAGQIALTVLFFVLLFRVVQLSRR